MPVTVDTAAPTARSTITAIADDTGASSSDFITSDTVADGVGHATAHFVAGETVQVSSDGGATWVAVTQARPELELRRSGHARHQLQLSGAGCGRGGQCRQHRQPGGDDRYGGAGGAGRSPRSRRMRRRHQRRRGLNGTPVVVGLTGTGAVAGDTLSINWGGQTVSYTLAGGGDITGNSATVTVPAGDDRGAGRRHVRRDGRADRCGGQCRPELAGGLGDGRHGGADGGGGASRRLSTTAARHRATLSPATPC